MKIGLDFPERYYPRSFLSLLLLAFALVATPLIVAFYNAAVYVEQLAGHSQTAVSQAAQASRGSRLLVEQATALERAVRQSGRVHSLDRVSTMLSRPVSGLPEVATMDSKVLRPMITA